MAAKPLVYVHGAGVQKRPRDLKDELDQVIFGRPMTATRVAHYSDVRWPPAGPVGGRPSGAATDRAARERAVRAAAKPQVTPKDAASEIVAATLAAGQARGRGPSASGRTGAGTARESAGPSGTDTAAARRLVEQLYRSADRVGERSAAPTPPVGGITFPDLIFRRVVGAFASDVVDYLYGDFAERMRAPVRQALLIGPAPKVIVAHSLGTIITYDVLSEPAFSGFSVELLVTLGSPLGIGNVQARLRNRAGRPNPVPSAVRAWVNFADQFDPVALDRTLRNEFSPPKDFATDESVNNPARNNHDLTGYLSIGVVRSAIVNAVGQ